MSAFVGISQKLLSADELQNLISKLANDSSYYFLRWANRVSGITKKLGNFPMLEGQMFNSELELRWKQKGANYEAFLLSSTAREYPNFEPLDREWETEDKDAYFYPPTETRFPKGFDYPPELKIGQRYFRDKKTATVHFVALTIKKSIGEKS
ncbi:hypothetical protein APA_1298 [Pseudanabaena sp. lw0831]|uniref:hypothetical protein n=1 Tax=Pseudanabaena sp. lw0831 TaxID=1357935 RepID=UPI001916625A|nr:hypothetical protein [Pseudanabaena sp. lw0831]GBO53391.1 hypothetical protein APA_1298 [Pseudanabaena sp. lw0831]